MKISHLLAAAVLASTSLTSAAANLVVNGSFEQPLQDPGTWGIYANIPGWIGEDDIEIRNNYDGIAKDGVNFVELDTFDNGSMSQTIFASGRVRLSFWYSPRGINVVPVGSNTLAFSLGDLSGVLLADAPGLSEHDWQEFVGIADLGNSGSAVLRFTAQGISDQFGGSLDHVTVTAVPLPGALLMLGAALGCVGIGARRTSPL